MNFDASGIWGVFVIIAPIVLAAAIIWAMLRNRKSSGRHEIDRTEAATRKLYDEQSRDDTAEERR